MPPVNRSRLFCLRRDSLRAELEGDLHLTVNPLAIRNYALPGYVRFKKIGSKPLRRLLGIDLFYRFIKSRAPLILSGDWDVNATPVASTPTHLFITELVAANYDYRTTAAYALMTAEVDAGKALHYKKTLIDSRDKVEAHFTYYCGVCKSMAADGYLLECARDPICVMIGRRGEIIKEEKGRHRLAVAQSVGVPAIPVYVRHVHPLWVDGLRGRHAGDVAGLIRAGLRDLCLS